MEHTFTKVSLQGIKRALMLCLASSFMVITANAKDIDSEILIKKALVSLFAKNKELEERVKLLESNVFPKKDAPKGESQNPYAFADLVKQNTKQGKFTYGKATKAIVIREKPSIQAPKVLTLYAGSKVIIKEIAYSAGGNIWYKIDDDMFVYGKNITFWSLEK